MTKNTRMSRANAKRHLSVERSFEMVKEKRDSLLGFMRDPSQAKIFKEKRESTGNTIDLRALLTEKVEASRRSFNVAPPRATSDFNLDLEDIEEQRRQMEYFESLNKDSNQRLPEEVIPEEEEVIPEEEEVITADVQVAPDEEEVQRGDEIPGDAQPPDGKRESLIEVAPGIRIPLSSSEETWTAIMDGRVTVTKCQNCGNELTCIDESNLVICSDCWVFSPVEQDGANDPSPIIHSRASIGVKIENIFEWLASQENLE